MTRKVTKVGVGNRLVAITSAIGEILRPPPRIQYAALPYRRTKDGLRFLLITSLASGRWILPKGWPKKDGDAMATVVEEAWEEAGIRGTVQPEPAGVYSCDKKMEGGYEVACKVVVFPLAVRSVDDDYPESGQRKRKWMSAQQAAACVDESELRKILRSSELAAMLAHRPMPGKQPS